MRHSFLDEHAGLDSPVHRLDPRAKIMAFFALILIGVSTPPDRHAAFAGYFLFLGVVALFSRVPLKFVLKRMLIVIPFLIAAAVSIPFMGPDGGGGAYNLGIGALHASQSGLLVFWNVLLKSCMAILAVTLLSSTTPFPALMHGLERLCVPRLIVMLISFTYRYLFVLVDEAERMERARDSRGYDGRWLWHARAVGQMIGMLFLRSYERAERVYAAMTSRGFDGRAVAVSPLRLRVADSLFAAASVALLLFLRMAERWLPMTW